MYYKKNSIELQFKKEVELYPRCKKGVAEKNLKSLVEQSKWILLLIGI